MSRSSSGGEGPLLRLARLEVQGAHAWAGRSGLYCLLEAHGVSPCTSLLDVDAECIATHFYLHFERTDVLMLPYDFRMRWDASCSRAALSRLNRRVESSSCA